MELRRPSGRAVTRAPARGAPARHHGASPAQALALQRAAGNRATARVLARQAGAGVKDKPVSGSDIDTTDVEIRFYSKQVKFQALSFYWPLAVNEDWRFGVEITKYVDRTSPTLWEWDAQKDHPLTERTAEVIATLRWGGRTQTETLKDVYITSHRLNPPKHSGERPTETITLNAAQQGLPFQPARPGRR